jgi:hypothetical protein
MTGGASGLCDVVAMVPIQPKRNASSRWLIIDSVCDMFAAGSSLGLPVFRRFKHGQNAVRGGLTLHCNVRYANRQGGA